MYPVNECTYGRSGKEGNWICRDIGALLLLVVSLVCGWAMFAVSGMENYEPLLKTVRYSLNWEMGMGFYDKPGGTEQMVMYPEDGADLRWCLLKRRKGNAGWIPAS